MKVYVAKKAGFCTGVERALDIVMRKVHDDDQTPVFTHGPLIHNPHVVKRLAALGIKVAGNIEDLPPGSYLVIRSHGIGPTERNRITELNLKIIDATCVHVKRLQQIVCDLYGAGYKLVILGLKDHPEIKALRDFVGDDCIIANTMEELPTFEGNPGKIGVVAQTTLSTDFFEKAVKHFLDQSIEDLTIKETICYATIQRQEAAKELSEKVELMIVIGGLISSNTKKLAEVCLSKGVTTYHVESPDHIKDEWLKGVENIGLTAGASTPDWMIDHVLRDLEEKGYQYASYYEDEDATLFDDLADSEGTEDDD